jgi:hypothetical protein
MESCTGFIDPFYLKQQLVTPFTPIDDRLGGRTLGQESWLMLRA